MNQRWALIFCVWIWISPVWGQNGSLLFNHLGVTEGLSEAANVYVYKDSRGFVWISSPNGLNRFDGTSVTKYFPNTEDSCALKGENIQSTFFEKDSSSLWFTTTKGINRYDWKLDCFKSYMIHVADDSLDNYQAFFYDSTHNLWILGTSPNRSYVFIFNLNTHQDKLIAELTSPGMRSIAVSDASGNVKSIWTYWLNEIGVEKIEVDNQQHLIARQTLWDSTSIAPLKIKQVIAQGDSVIWALSSNTLLKYNLRNKSSHSIPIHQGEAQCLYLADDTTLLIGFLQSGMWEFNIPKQLFTNQYQHIPEDPLSLISNNVIFICKDKSGDLWIGSRGIGLSYAHPQKKKFNTFYPPLNLLEIGDFTPTTFLPENYNALFCATRSNGFFIINRTGKNHQEMKQVQNLNPKSLLGSVHDVFKDQQDRYWVVTFPGLSVFDVRTSKLLHVNHEQQVLLSGIPWSKDKMLFGGRGLYEIEGDMDKGFIVKQNPFVPDTIQYVPIWLDMKGRLWLVEYDGQFLILDSNDFHTIDTLVIPGISTHKAESADGKTIWIISSKGLYEIDSDSLLIRNFYNENTGCPAGGFNSMIMDLSGRLWLTSNLGIYMFDPKIGKLRNYNQEDGVPSLQYTAAAYRFDDGEIWFGSMRGITRFYPDDIKDINVAAIPQITEIQINDRPAANKLVCEITGASNIPLIKQLTFDYQHNTLAFRLNALEYSSPRHNKVQYQMENLDDKLIETSSGSLVRYPNMGYGHYRLVVYAFNSDGVQNPQPHVLLIHIKPPYYKTWWFVTLMILLAGSLLAYIVYLRFSKALELQRVRLKLYENLHDDVGSRLTAIVLSAEDLERNENIHHPKIQAISKIAKSIVGNMRRLVWAIDPENDKMTNLIQKITHDKSLILDENISFQVKVEDQLKNNIVPGEIRYQIISICNEAFNNISKYAKAKAVTVSITKGNRNYHLTIQDDGVGFDPASAIQNAVTGSGYGLNNMKRRASRVKGKLEIFSKPGEGTRIEVDFPY